MLTTITQPRAAAPVSSCANWQWPPERFQLVSLWDMLKIHANNFILLMSTLSQVKDGLKAMLEQIDDARERMVALGPDSVNAFDNETKGVSVESTSVFRSFFDDILTSCDLLKLDLSLVKATRIRESIESTMNLIDVQKQTQELLERIQDEIRNRVFMFVPNERVKYFTTEPLFGEIVRATFPEATADIEDAGICLAVGRPTAAVYHLMRVMEYGIKRIAKRLLSPAKVKTLRAAAHRTKV